MPRQPCPELVGVATAVAAADAIVARTVSIFAVVESSALDVAVTRMLDYFRPVC